MTVKSQTGFFPALLDNRHYSGTMSTLLYNWPVFASIFFFGVVMLAISFLLSSWWSWLCLICGLGALAVIGNVLAATYVVYDWGDKREYDRLAELGHLEQANVVIDVTCGKLRGTRGLLSRFRGGHYFLIDIYHPQKMTEAALRRAREMEPPLETTHRIYHRPSQANRLPLPHNWADVVYCNFCLHEIRDSADRNAIFAEFARILKPEGRLLLAEHSLDLANFLAFGPGSFSFFSADTWRQHLATAALNIHHHERWRGLVHLWVAGRNPRNDKSSDE
ncbi:MAG: methyltransferase domain-containing protein [Anaerolineae bacterium]|nr:methyltransferase domain-containing protein [Anaerolineae bacterium]